MKHRKSIGRSLIALAAGSALILLSATPAASQINTITATYVSGTIRLDNTFPFVDLDFNNPSGTTAPCTSTSGITGSTNTTGTTTGTATITITLASVFQSPTATGATDPWYKLVASGTGTGAWNQSTLAFAGVNITPITFVLSNISSTTCVVGTTICTGTASLTAGGTALTAPPATSVPWPAGSKFKVTATGTILTSTTCGFPFNFAIRVGTVLRLLDYTGDCYLNPGTPAPPAPPALQTCGTGSTADGAAIFQV